MLSSYLASVNVFPVHVGGQINIDLIAEYMETNE